MQSQELLGPVFVELPIDILYSYLLIASNTGLVVQKSKSTITSEDIPNVIIPSDYMPAERQENSTKAYLDSLWPNAPVYLSKDKSDNSSGGVFNDIANSAGSGDSSTLTGMVTEKVLQMYVRWLFIAGQDKVDVTHCLSLYRYPRQRTLRLPISL